MFLVGYDRQIIRNKTQKVVPTKSYSSSNLKANDNFSIYLGACSYGSGRTAIKRRPDLETR